MLIIPSFKKSLIVEQFQGNYLKLPTISAPRFSVSRVNSSIQRTVESVKATFGIEDKSTNGPEGTISSLTQESLDMFHEGMNACTGRDNNELPCIPPVRSRPLDIAICHGRKLAC